MGRANQYIILGFVHVWTSCGKQGNNLNIKLGCYLYKEWEGIVIRYGHARGCKVFGTILFSENGYGWWANMYVLLLLFKMTYIFYKSIV